MRISMRNFVRIALLAALVAGIAGCGSGTNNDQGTAFTLFGFFKDAGTTGDAGRIVQIGPDTEGGAESGESGLGVLTFYGIQNNLAHQGIRTQRAFLSFFIEGAAEQPPSTTVALASVLGPSGTSSTNVPAGSLPPNWSNIKNVMYTQSFIVPPEIVTWILFNQNKLPQMPFTMTVHTYVTGLTTAGDRMDTNPLDFFVEFRHDDIIPPTGGTGGGAGSSSAGSASSATADGEF